MSSSSGAATQIYSAQFDRRFLSLPPDIQTRVQHRIDSLGQQLKTYPHYRMQGVDTYRLRIGDFRIIYQFNIEKNELNLIAVGNRREIYKKPLN